ncbi:long-chain-fatty-acid--CoA ligase heimdall [Stomoxys calcitrans]|uniref:long-chain-fatty-acid--CoA ligase heimdall n=1 Tax=Stomoxys calcitrans TaxID=35570 RepID=UPI0027E34F27|nr:long-chain-fatty-acid--CoA ligase heimdall [Stomoxys calcitrans]
MAPLKPTENKVSCSLNQAVKILSSEESLAEIKPKTIPEFFKECCEKFQHLPALKYKTSEHSNVAGLKEATDSWCTVTYGDYQTNVEKAALALLSLGVGARTSVGILAPNCPEWFYVHLGAICINAVSVGIYASNSAETIFHILETSNASAVLVDDTHQLNKIREIRSRLPPLKAVIQLNGPFDFEEQDKAEGYYRWSELMEMPVSSSLREELATREREVAPNECALLIFTSGTVGMPKGVMISHDGVLYCAQSVTQSLPSIRPGPKTAVSYLPLSHIAAQLFDIFMAMENGVTVYFADRNALKGSIGRTLVAARPSFFFGVPRIFEKIQEKLTQVDAETKGFMKCCISKAREMMLQYHLDRMAGKPTSYVKYWLASCITNRIKYNIGFNLLENCYIGGAPVSPELKCFFLSLDLPLSDVFGMSETSGGVIFNYSGPNLETIGKPIGGQEVKIQDPNAKGEGEEVKQINQFKD